MPTTSTSTQTAVAQPIKEQPLQMDSSAPHCRSADSMDAGKNADGLVEGAIKGGVNDIEESGAEPVDSDSRKDKDSKSPSTADDDDIAENLRLLRMAFFLCDEFNDSATTTAIVSSVTQSSPSGLLLGTLISMPRTPGMVFNLLGLGGRHDLSCTCIQCVCASLAERSLREMDSDLQRRQFMLSLVKVMKELSLSSRLQLARRPFLYYYPLFPTQPYW